MEVMPMDTTILKLKIPQPNQQTTVHKMRVDNNFESKLDSRFELLSAYLDGEVTPAERQQVQQWLDNDPEFQKLYTQLLGLSQEIQVLPVPTPAQSTQELSEQVFRKIEKRRRLSKLLVITGGSIAAVVIGGISGLLSGNSSLVPKIAQRGEEPLMIAINEPVVAIPKPPVATD
jgi:anti-sigma factor RsiW